MKMLNVALLVLVSCSGPKTLDINGTIGEPSFLADTVEGEISDRVSQAALRLQYGLSETEGTYLFNVEISGVEPNVIFRDRVLRKAAALVVADDTSIVDSQLPQGLEPAPEYDAETVANLSKMTLGILGEAKSIKEYILSDSSLGPTKIAAAYLLDLLYAGDITVGSAADVINFCGVDSEGACLDDRALGIETATCMASDRTVSPTDDRCLEFTDVASDMGCRDDQHWSDLNQACAFRPCPDGYVLRERSCASLRGVFEGSVSMSYDADCDKDRTLTLVLDFSLDGRKVTAVGENTMLHRLDGCNYKNDTNLASFRGRADGTRVVHKNWSGTYLSWHRFELELSDVSLSLIRSQ